MAQKGVIQRIREWYGVPAKRGMLIKIAGKEAKITGTRGFSLLVRFTEDPSFIRLAHPVWSVEYPQETQ